MGNKKTDPAVTVRYNVKVENCGSAKLEFSWEEGNDSACHPFPVVLPKCSSPDLRVGSSKPLAAAEKVTYSLTEEVKGNTANLSFFHFHHIPKQPQKKQSSEQLVQFCMKLIPLQPFLPQYSMQS